MVSKDEAQTVFTEDNPKLVLRSKELHDEHCVLNSLQFCHSTDNFTVNIMHDLLEGVVQNEVKLVFQYHSQTDYKVSVMVLPIVKQTLQFEN